MQFIAGSFQKIVTESKYHNGRMLSILLQLLVYNPMLMKYWFSELLVFNRRSLGANRRLLCRPFGIKPACGAPNRKGIRYVPGSAGVSPAFPGSSSLGVSNLRLFSKVRCGIGKHVFADIRNS
jgi:hypothetical protein